MQQFNTGSVDAGVDEELLRGVFESSRVGLGLLAFHSAFLHYIARPPGVAIDKVHYLNLRALCLLSRFTWGRGT